MSGTFRLGPSDSSSTRTFKRAGGHFVPGYGVVGAGILLLSPHCWLVGTRACWGLAVNPQSGLGAVFPVIQRGRKNPPQDLMIRAIDVGKYFANDGGCTS